MLDVLGKMRECGKYIKMRDFPHDCGMVDTYDIVVPMSLMSYFTCIILIVSVHSQIHLHYALYVHILFQIGPAV